MLRITPSVPYPLHDTTATRRIEQAAAAALPPHTLMQRAGLAVARLALALAPHARTVWIACGPGNNGGDGFEAAMHLRQWGLAPVVTWLGDEAHAPADARASLARARAAGVCFADAPPALQTQDLCIDALLGIGVTRAPEGRMAAWLAHMAASPARCLAVDLPTGLNADTGRWLRPDAIFSEAASACYTGTNAHFDTENRRHTLSLLTLKPGLFTCEGRDACGTLWFDDLGVAPETDMPASAWLSGPPAPAPRAHASHKGSFGDVAVVGGEGLARRGLGMTGAALLAASAALHGGAGRVLLALLDDAGLAVDVQQPELMLRRFEALELDQLSVVCGCGGGEAVRAVLPAVLERAARLVLDADALNTIATAPPLHALLAARAGRGQPTVLTPHPLEAARLLDTDAASVQADRLRAACALAERFQCVAVLKGSGTVVAAPGAAPSINPTGNARLATAGTGDVLAGLIGARLAAGHTALQAACAAVYQHGQAADQWPAGRTLTAGALARSLCV
ncbi:NAD(P)H-hydrate dehydratase [Extensimonas sp. H3M7-6]|uniref:NAD(P)H-hydrate dehydratase n=1 Tax=Extensimonas soli TaxID=3031322 RepID=UPI0023DB127E|nr:NAD(P)H-hydrate dehydratase [Extensimonas sp. H3M7-6]MDF1482315.1 NAD(P)H-hydrate dehydratase [Extensimonas sp. H3M7-6]